APGDVPTQRWVTFLDNCGRFLGKLARIYAADLVFHNAYGPDKAWFYDAALSGGGCVMDLGVHLVDLALWVLDFPAVGEVPGRLFAGGEPLNRRADRVEDYAVATLEMGSAAAVRLAARGACTPDATP